MITKTIAVSQMASVLGWTDSKIDREFKEARIV